jgi:hypothetical protein
MGSQLLYRYGNVSCGFVLPKTVGLDVKEINSLGDIPLIGFAFPLVGLFIAPIYPLLNSVVLSPQKLQLDDWVNCRFFCSLGLGPE